MDHRENASVSLNRRTARYAVWLVPQFSLQAVTRQQAAAGMPMVLAEDVRGKSTVVDANREAQELSIRPGIPTVQALARCSYLQILQAHAVAEAELTQILLELAWTWVPRVELTRDGVLTLDLSTLSDVFFEKLQPECLRLWEALQVKGITCHMGIGRTPDLAQTAALLAAHQAVPMCSPAVDPQHYQQQLQAAPLGLCGLSDALHSDLQDWGIYTVGQYTAIAYQEIAERLGEEGCRLWLQLSGRTDRPLKNEKEAPEFRCRRDLDYEVTDREALLHEVSRAAVQILPKLQASGKSCPEVKLLMGLADGTAQWEEMPLAESSAAEGPIMEAVEHLVNKLRPRCGVEWFEVELSAIEPTSKQEVLLGDSVGNEFRFRETIERLKDLLGEKACYLPSQAFADYRSAFHRQQPDYQRVRQVISLESIETSPERVHGSSCLFRPFPMPVSARVAWQQGQPRRLSCQSPFFAARVAADQEKKSWRVLDSRGPWKESSHWWEPEQARSSDEWDILVDEAGWMRLSGDGERWVIEGTYN